MGTFRVHPVQRRHHSGRVACVTNVRGCVVEEQIYIYSIGILETDDTGLIEVLPFVALLLPNQSPTSVANRRRVDQDPGSASAGSAALRRSRQGPRSTSHECQRPTETRRQNRCWPR